MLVGELLALCPGDRVQATELLERYFPSAKGVKFPYHGVMGIVIKMPGDRGDTTAIVDFGADGQWECKAYEIAIAREGRG